MKPEPGPSHRPSRSRQRLPRSFKELTPTKAFNPRTFFYEMVWKALLTRRKGQHKKPDFPKLNPGQVAITWIGHASFLIQFRDLNVLIDPNFANWLFLLKRIKRAGVRISHLPPIDLVLLTHAHFDHFHKPTLRRLPRPKIVVMPWGMSDLAHDLGFERVIELEWWESFSRADWTVTLTPCRHWVAFFTPVTALISTASNKLARAFNRRSHCCPSALITRTHFAMCTWDPMKR